MPAGSYLPSGLNASNDTQIHDRPAGSQAAQQPPLDRATVTDVGCDIQRLPVPEVAHGTAALALLYEPWDQKGPVRG